MFAIMGSVNGADSRLGEKSPHSFDIETIGCCQHGINPRTLTVRADISPEVQLPLVALDIGGSLAKVAYVTQENQNDQPGFVSIDMVSYSVDNLDDFLAFVRNRVLRGVGKRRHTVRSTGVGCTKYRNHISQTLGIDLETDGDEMDHALDGVDFMWRHLPAENLLYENSDVNGLRFGCPLAESGMTPCIHVTLGSAVIINLVDKDGKSGGLVGGSSQGGLTLLGLGALLTNTQSFSQLIELGDKGERKKVDLLVKDAAGSDYSMVTSECMVSSFGKIVNRLAGQKDDDIKREDLASSLLYMITDQMAQTAYLVAKCQQVSNVIFCGSYLSQNSTAMTQIKEKFKNCALFLGTEMKTSFMKNEGYASVLGILSSQLRPVTANGCHS